MKTKFFSNWLRLTAVLTALAVLLGALAPTTVAHAESGLIVAWGWNAYGQIDVPAGLSGVTAIAGGDLHSLALKEDGTVVVWGDNGFGQGNVPAGLSGVTAIDASAGHNLALKADGTVVAWGWNDFGQTDVPADLTDGTVAVTAIAAGGMHSLALKSDGTVVAWGDNTYGQSSVPADLTDGTVAVTAIAAGYYHSLALKADGTVVAWGDNTYGQTDVPADLSGVTAIATYGMHGLALKGDGTVVAWGLNDEGQTDVPADLSGVTAIAAGGFHSLALKADGTVVAWGYDYAGETDVPAGLSGVTAIASGAYHSLALKSVTAPVVPQPTLNTITPASAAAGSGDLDLTVNGSDFVDNSVVRWNGADLITTYVSSSELTALIPASSLAAVQTAQITVFTPAPGSGISSILAFYVTQASAGVSEADVTSGDSPTATIGPVTATATGSGLVAVAQYDANPGGTPSFTASGTYFDVYVAPGNTFSQVSIVACNLNSNDKLFWWDAAQDKWRKASPQSFDQSSGCVTLIVTEDSSPSLSQLQGTFFAPGVETNTAPTADPGGPYLGAVNTAIPFDGSASSDPENDPLTYVWNFGDNSTLGTGVMPSHSYTATGIYDVCLTVDDGALASEASCTIAVVYDPEGGFVTGGGWILSPAGAYAADPSLAGKATFGFVSKYKKGASVPTGNTAFAFDLAGFEFYSDSYEWLVVNQAGTNAQFKGSGMVNDALDPNGNPYKFMLWAGDGATSGDSDTFRIKIWWEDGDGVEYVVYDNGFDQPIGGGSIVVHTGK